MSDLSKLLTAEPVLLTDGTSTASLTTAGAVNVAHGEATTTTGTITTSTSTVSVSALDGYTGAQRFFLGWAQVWSGKARPEEAKRLLAVDPHSPTEVRANAVRNCDEFHEAFGVTEGDGMWLAPQDRVHIF